jgi:hypothetical protein
MERLTKTELRALLEFIKECYPICDLETFSQRVVSRLSKIVPQRKSFIAGQPARFSNERGGGFPALSSTKRFPDDLRLSIPCCA